MQNPYFDDPYVGRLKWYYWIISVVFFVAALVGLCRLSATEEWESGSLGYAIAGLVIFALFETAGNEPESLYDFTKPNKNGSKMNRLGTELRNIFRLLWKKTLWWGITFLILFGMHSCYMDQVRQEEALQRWEHQKSEERTRIAWERTFERRAKEDSIRKNMKYTITKTHSGGSDDDNDDGYFDGLDDAELDRETGAEYGTSYDDSGGENDDYDDGYESGYDDEW